jgi:hypothetical protein
MQREPRNQQDRGRVGMAGDVNQRAVGIAAFRHKGGERALAAAPQQRTGQFGSIKICGGLHVYFPANLLQKRSFSRPKGMLYVEWRITAGAFCGTRSHFSPACIAR